MTLVWPDNAIAGQWLRVTVNPTLATGQVSDVFYFGNAIAEAGNSTFDANVTSADELQARANQAFGVSPTNRWGYNRDGKVGTADQLIARSHTTIGAAALQLITAPAAAAAGASALVDETSGDAPPPSDAPTSSKAAARDRQPDDHPHVASRRRPAAENTTKANRQAAGQAAAEASPGEADDRDGRAPQPGPGASG